MFLAGRWGRRVQIHLVFSTDKTPSQEGTLLYNKHITHGNILERFYRGILENMSGVRPGGHWLRLHLPAQGGGFDPWAGSSDPMSNSEKLENLGSIFMLTGFTVFRGED